VERCGVLANDAEGVATWNGRCDKEDSITAGEFGEWWGKSLGCTRQKSRSSHICHVLSGRTLHGAPQVTHATRYSFVTSVISRSARATHTATRHVIHVTSSTAPITHVPHAFHTSLISVEYGV
jgi:hypothetical protein